jgi:tRNA 2-thiouridine synthesizing protein C
VIFIEDGVYTLTGNHLREEGSEFSSLQEIINLVAGNDNLQFYAFQPSLHRRSMSKNPKLNAVLDIGMAELGQLLFYPPKGVQAGHQRVIFF